MTLKKAYYYVFYKLYKSFEASPSRFWSEWKASLLMDILVGAIIIALGVSYTVVTKKDFVIFNSTAATWLMIIVIALGNYIIFNHTDRWKGIVSEFDKLPRKKNRLGSIIVWSVIILIIAAVIFIFYLMSQIDWKQYR